MSISPKVIYRSHDERMRRDILFPEIFTEVVEKLINPLTEGTSAQKLRHIMVQTNLRKKHKNGNYYLIQFMQYMTLPLEDVMDVEKTTLDYISDGIMRMNRDIYFHWMQGEEFDISNGSLDEGRPITEWNRMMV